ncbi:hypothetical protein SPRG_11874 [Saprolegnia parasitica CBS 223.65]|uniref:Uncharacterized protein n=1 Tax=Saprolegnia parasitica (strain CBS 223.65) TaxID=695850 RepID=A0A067C879_SAPPC|nr:hypothetical protein SPRG_11874 [Saprolegnia parasitica CBS 223.65]KDO23027.1 hypothetical protein SPRG_11874 [Saprolegnia parasitica CBS 223.65]|eukprot:XP_012206315.1 hypothetical protein SPRG_11874 [Saprolegnia parasitica CBS 223.65]
MRSQRRPAETPPPGAMTVSYLSASYWCGLFIMAIGVVLPLVYMFLQNKKAFKSVRRD